MRPKEKLAKEAYFSKRMFSKILKLSLQMDQEVKKGSIINQLLLRTLTLMRR